MSNHTPGPWTVVPANGAMGNVGFCVKSGSSDLIVKGSEANARLIAAAPELLAMAKDMLEHVGPQSYAGKNLAVLIARAEGRA